MRRVRCFLDCRAKWTEDPNDCHCSERDELLREDFDNDAVDRYRDEGGEG